MSIINLRPPILDATQRALAVLTRLVQANTPAPKRAFPAVTKTGQTAAITTTNLVPLAKSGTYRIVAILQCTTADGAAGTIGLTLAWTSRSGARTDANLTRALTAAGDSFRDHTVEVQGDTAITYAVALTAGAFGTSVYALEIRGERMPD